MPVDRNILARVRIADGMRSAGVVPVRIDDRRDRFVAEFGLHFQRIEPHAIVYAGVEQNQTGIAFNKGEIGQPAPGNRVPPRAYCPGSGFPPRAILNKGRIVPIHAGAVVDRDDPIVHTAPVEER